MTAPNKNRSVFLDKLRSLRRSMRRWVLVDGLIRVLAVLVGLVALDFAIDWYFQLDRPQRAIMLALMVLALCYAVYRWVLRPLSRRVTNESMLLEVQKRFPDRAKGLLTAFELAEMRDASATGASPELIEEAIRVGNASSENVRFGEILRRKRFAFNFLVLTTLLVAVGLGIAATRTNLWAGIYFDRNILLGDSSWPQDFEFVIDGESGGNLTIPRGDDWPVTARIKDGYKRLPEDVTVEVRLPQGRRRETMAPGDDGRTFVFPLSEVREGFSFRLRSNRVRTPWKQVKLIDRPVLDTLEIESTPPQYTGRGVEKLASGAETHAILKGTALRLQGRTSKPLQSATLKIGDQTLPFQIEENRISLTLDPGQVVPGTWAISFVDTSRLFQPGLDQPAGLAAREATVFNVRHVPDRAPKVKMTTRGVGNLILPGAMAPYTGSAEDDFKITGVKVQWSWKGDEGKADEIIGSLVPKPVTALLGQESVAFEDMIEVSDFKVEEGSRLRLRLEATDNDNVSGPNRGEAAEVFFRVVTESQLRNALLIREKQQRQLMEALLKKQDILMTDCEGFLGENKAVTEPDGAIQSVAAKLHRRQKQVGAGLRPILENLSAMLEEIRNNRLPDESDVLKRRLGEQIIAPMANLYEGALPTASAHLDRARAQLADQKARNDSLGTAITTQRAIMESMRAILVNMVENEKFQLAVIKLYEIKRLQEKLKNETLEEKEKALERLLEE